MTEKNRLWDVGRFIQTLAYFEVILSSAGCGLLKVTIIKTDLLEEENGSSIGSWGDGWCRQAVGADG